ncbi:MAG: bifunctional folylpolyglutamate synthase/dihydrofolate synthase [Bacteroidales bacterium]|nr:bifunctional folylpolyglutamate synthase/dihydrofolate synthase [Bacteroidales bacterium]
MEFTQAGYESLVQDIFRRFPSVQKVGFKNGAYKPGLERMRAFDQALGYPSRQFRSIHVAGTNGKGSVANMLASVLSSCGLRTGLFTSPHILDFRERMVVASRPYSGQMPPETGPCQIPRPYVFNFLTRWLPWITEHELSFFEITTGMAFRWFADQKVDVAVIEVGLGGRLDSTNILEKPELAIVTTIGLDHMALLGNTLDRIAAEKAGIFKAGVPALVGESNPETDPVFDAYKPVYADRVTPSLWFRHEALLKDMDLMADVQKHNLRTVLAAVDLLVPAFPALKDADAVLDGIVHTARNMAFHGRWERLSAQPYVVADIGHNAQALRYNFAQLERCVASGAFSSLIIVYGIMADKDLDAILPLMPQNATYIFTAPATDRALPADEILKRFLKARTGGWGPDMSLRDPVRAFSAPTVREAVQMAVQLAQNLSEQLSRSASAGPQAPPLVYIGGSTFVVSEALPLF